MNNLTGLAVSFAWVLLIIGIARLTNEKCNLSRFTARKIIHIGVCHWWLIALTVFDSLIWALIGPVAFVFINALSLRFGFMEIMSEPDGSGSLGTVYFPLALVSLVAAVWSDGIPAGAGTIAVLVLGWGDGVSALVGHRIGGPRVPGIKTSKTVAGMAAMFMVSLIITAGVAILNEMERVLWASSFGGGVPLVPVVLAVPAIAIVASITEAYSPYGLDNLAVPVTVAAAAHVMLG